MAGNKMNTKKKEDKSKTIRCSSQANEELDDIDFSLLRKPILTSITGFSQARKIFDVATEELKALISNECDLLYECKVCRNIFRSLVNFISHKRIYCKEKFNSSVHGHFIKSASLVNEVSKIKQLEECYQESLKEENKLDSVESKECDDRIPLTKDLTEVIERITKRKAIQDSALENHQLTLQKIPKSTAAVYQNINYDGQKSDSLRAQVQELNKLSSQENAVLQSDGKFKIQGKISTETENVIQISDDDDDSEDTNVHECKACDLQFTTLKTLKYHMKHKHLENRLVYPCPDCLVIFSTSWSVYRHLFKVHRKTAAQIRRLRESIQAKAFRMDNPPAFYEKRKTNVKNSSLQKKTEEERLEQENQEWMDNMEGDGELPRCGGCGRTFARLAALAAHTNTCQPRSRALARRPQETKKIEIQIRKDYNKGPPANMVFTTKSEANELKEENKDSSVTKSLLVKDTIVAPEESKLTEAVMTIIGDKKENVDADANTSMENKDISYENKFINRLPFAYQAEKSNLHALKQRMNSDVELESFLCKKCDMKFNDTQNLLDHMATHYKWIRYGCKLCNYKHYEFEKLPEHIKTVHKLKGDTDFYFSTLKAIDGPEALEISECADDLNDPNEASPESRRPSRCSSDSSRLSDDSSSSSVRVEGSRKRKINNCKTFAKRLRDSTTIDKSEDPKEDVTKEKVNIVENDSSSNSKTFEENSSDMDDNEEKVTKYPIIARSSVASRRPVRKKTKPKYEDFEYDLSNLLKMEAQGYRDSQVLVNRTNANKKKIQQETSNNYDIVNKEFTGALATLSRKSVENAKAQMKNTSFMYNSSSCNSRGPRIYNVFARPFAPKVSKSDKISPKKDLVELNNDHSPTKETKPDELPTLAEDPNENNIKEASPNAVDIDTEKILTKSKIPSIKGVSERIDASEDSKNKTDDTKDQIMKEPTSVEKDKSNTAGNVSVPTVFPFKFGRGIDVMKNPLIKKNLTDFTKAGMKTKILVIKPINRNKDGTQSLSTPLKFQTIKLKDPNKDNKTNEEKKSDQVVVVPVPKVDCAIRTASNNTNVDKSFQCSVPTTSKSSDNNNDIIITDASFDDNDTKNDVTLDTKSIKTDEVLEESEKEVLRPENVES